MYDLAMTASSSKLKHFVTRNEDDKTDPDNVSYCNVQEKIFGNYSMIEDAQKYYVAFDVMEIVLVRKVVDPKASACCDKYDD